MIAILLNLLLPFLLRVLSLFNLPPENDAGRSFCTHHSNFRCWPGENSIGPEFPVAQGHVSASVSLSQDHRDFGNGGFGIGKKDFGPVADNAAELLSFSRKVSCGVHQGEERNVKTIAEANESGSLVRCIDIQGSGQKHGIVGDDPDGVAVDPSKAHNDIFGIKALDLEEIVVIDDFLDDFNDVVRTLPLDRDDFQKLGVQAIQGIA